MPSPRPSSRPSPRPSGRSRASSWATWVGAAAALAFATLILTSISSGPVAPVREVAGAIDSQPPSTASPAAAAVATPTPTPTATSRPTPTPTPTPVPTPLPPEQLTGYEWPLPRGRLTLPFGPSPWGSRIVDGEKFHDGIDLATFCGDRIVAAHSGTVLAAGRRFDRHMGWVGDLEPYLQRLEKKQLWGTLPIVVVIEDGNGYRSVYAHFRKVVVEKGQRVDAGELLGYEGATGRASGCHLHFGIFSPLETATFEIDPTVVKRMKLPDRQIARIDPMLVLPERPEPTRKPTPSPSMSVEP
jgi:murein DD-endopeptidase MepM/ murein hydrolase activator NlpD